MSTNELFEALQGLLEGEPQAAGLHAVDPQQLFKELRIHQLELEIQNRDLRGVQQQLAHSRTRYADLYDFSPIGYASLDENARIEEINITGGKLLGENPTKLIGNLFTDFVASSDVSRFTAHLQRCRRSRRKRSIELRLVTGDGLPVDVELLAMATHDIDRYTFQFRIAIFDITTRKRAAAARDITERRQRGDAQRFLSDASAVLSASLDNETILWSLARVAIPHLADCCVVDIVQDDGSIKRLAAAHIRPEKERLVWQLERYPLDAANAAFGRDKVVRTGRAEVYAEVSDTLLAALAQNSEHLELLRELGFTSFMCVPMIVRGRTIGSIGFMLEGAGRKYNLADLALAEDLADRAAMAVDNASLYSKEQEANRLKDEFLATVSHELRTPLTPILGAIFKLKTRRRGDEDLLSTLDVIERNARTQARIVEDLLDISRITTGKLDLNRRPTDLTQTVDTAIQVIRPAAEALGIQLETSLEQLPTTVWCDRDRIQQVIWNLLSNAITFTPHGGKIEVRLEDRDKRARIRISDTGVGISREFLPHVFERFRQADTFTTRMHGGLGLGLSIVRYIVENHGGSVRAESAGEGKGASFTVDLPYS